MPAFYAHYRFGDAVLRRMPEEIRCVCAENRALFDTAVNGPDFFFFYRPVLRNHVNEIGHSAHRLPGRTFLLRGRQVVEDARDRGAATAYLYGLICHFAMDSVCHPYVAEAMRTYGLTHAAVETAFDRALLVLDGIDPLTFDPVGRLDVTRRAAAVIAPFYPPAVTDIVEKSLKSTLFYGRLFYNQNRPLRFALDKSLYITLHHDALYDMLMTKTQNPRCAESDAHLLALFDEALRVADVLLPETRRFLEDGTPGSALFDKTFAGK